MRSIRLICALSLALPLAGCGGGSSAPVSSVASVATGRAAFKVAWPKANPASRLIPLAAQSIKITLFNGKATLASRILVNDGSGSATYTFDGLPVLPLTAVSVAYATTDATGAALATGSVDVQIVSGQTTSTAITMASTIDHITTDYKGVSLEPSETADVMATAYDASGAVVLLSNSQLIWNSSDASKINVSSTATGATLTGVDGGAATITVTDTESSLSATFPVQGLIFTVTPNSPVVSIGDTVQFAALVSGPTNTDVTWAVTDADGSPISVGASGSGGTVSGKGLFTAPTVAGIYYVQAVSAFDPARKILTPITVQSGSATVDVN